MSSNNNNILLQNTLESFVEQLILLNKKIENLENKINNINSFNNIILYDKKIKKEIDWDSIHLY